MKFPFYDGKATGHGILLPCSRSVVKPSFGKNMKAFKSFLHEQFSPLPSPRLFPFLFSSFMCLGCRMDMRIKLLVIFHSTDFLLALLYRFKYFILLCLILRRMHGERTNYIGAIHSKDDNGCEIKIAEGAIFLSD